MYVCTNIYIYIYTCIYICIYPCIYPCIYSNLKVMVIKAQPHKSKDT